MEIKSTFGITANGTANSNLDTNVYSDGIKGAKAYQEDNWIQFVSKNRKVIIGGIFDGHGGYNGRLASQCAAKSMMEFFVDKAIECESWSNEQWETHLRQLFETTHDLIRRTFVEEAKDTPQPCISDEKGIVRTMDGAKINGGSTATIVVSILPDVSRDHLTIITANCGDSMAMLIKLDTQSGIGPNHHRILTEEHGPGSNAEFERLTELDPVEYPDKLLVIYDKKTVSRKYECPRVFRDTDGRRDQRFVKDPWGHGLYPKNVRYEPAVYAVTPRNITTDSTCIAITRSLGDFYAHQFGLSNIPSICVHTESVLADYQIVIASDGVWDVWKYDEFVEIIRSSVNDRAYTGKEIVQSVLSQSLQKGIGIFGEHHYDDISCVSWRIENGHQ